jgi:erythromycin esterase-like protein
MSETSVSTDVDVLLERMTDARFALIGEASHGTHEFYRERAEITKRLIAKHGYTVIAAEADWPDAYRVNLFVLGESDDDAEEALQDFRRFPSWMWRNRDVLEFVTWLREWNDALPSDQHKVGFYGLDLYSLHTSMEEVVRFLEGIDPAAAQRARERYACFDHFGREPQVYAYETGVGGAEPCEQQAVAQLMEMQGELVPESVRQHDPEGYFYAEQNARLVANAERYYRAMFRGGIKSWNLRDTHMAETLFELVGHLDERLGRLSKVVVWAHNSHVGDARATELGEAGELNVGQLVREARGNESLLVGFSTYTGTVTAASDWGDPAERRTVLPALEGSWEQFFHERDEERFLVATAALDGRRLERAIGVVYRPETERTSHYFHARIAQQFDAVIHFDETRAVEPLEVTSEWSAAEAPETYPFGV